MDHYESRSWDAWHRHILLALIAHLLIVKLRIKFSHKLNKPQATPYVTEPVSLDDYLEAHQQMLKKQEITHPYILESPLAPQQILTIGLIQKLVCAAFPKIGRVIIEIDYMLMKFASAFKSHSLSVVNKVIQQYGQVHEISVRNHV